MNRRNILWGLAGVTGCAPLTVQSRLTPPPSFEGPGLAGDEFVAADGARLGLTVWPAKEAAKAVIVGLHGMNDYANAFHLAAPIWSHQGIATYAFDQRGFGRSVGRGLWAGPELMIDDLHRFVRLVRQRHPAVPITVVGESMGGAVAICAFASDSPPEADSLVLLAPAVWGWSSQPLPNRTLLWLTARLAPDRPVTPPGWLSSVVQPSDNLEELRAMGQDPQMIWGARPDTLFGLVGLMEAASRDIGRIKAPIAYLYGARDQVIPRSAALSAAARIKSSDRSAWYDRGYHLLIRDRQRDLVIQDVASLVLRPEKPLPSAAPAIPRTGHRYS
jgi:alpha-beta hydrolase superfamily lysophospholipase